MERSSKYGKRWDTTKRGETLRPFRIWDAKAKKNVRWRYYRWLESAVRGIGAELLSSTRAVVYELYDVRTGRLHRQYIRNADGITIKKET